ncbi:MAG: ATPase [SAR86 cluster bacterium]|uniref:ATPase n=1 Tax=SAR86 cluster bacterium TaxID=2030880 RepID=A0A2A5B0M5_9GAMM|nr:MAG: ATPase [SAR86 cluster bacterium]
MIKPDWNTFKAKFSENPQENFEWFCFLLFCKEFDKPIGIFRYKNQAAIETDPVVVGEQEIAWQAKFFDTRLSENSTTLIKCITDTKKYYPSVTKLILYSNQEWGQTKGTTPKSKTKIDDKAFELGLTLEWRTKSYFESPFVSQINEEISRHFFSPSDSIFDLQQKLIFHTDIILHEINTEIIYLENKIHIDRSSVLNQIDDSSSNILILSGAGGTGKTATIKEFRAQLGSEVPFFTFKATEFDIQNINELFPAYDHRRFLESYEADNQKLLVIDSAEKLLDFKNTQPFREFLANAIENKWKIIFTTRSSYLSDLNFQFFEIYKVVPTNILLLELTLDELENIAKQYDFSLPTDNKLRTLIRNPFYLSEYLKFHKASDKLDYPQFRNKLWKNIVEKSKPARERAFLDIAFERADKGRFFVNPEVPSAILDDELRSDGLIGYESKLGYFITHDIYEEWALENIVESAFVNTDSQASFFDTIGQSLPIRRSFRIWISEKLRTEDSSIIGFIEEIFEDTSLPKHWKDEVIVAVLLSEYSETFFRKFRSLLLNDDNKLLKDICFLIRIACKEVDDSFLLNLGIKAPNVFSLNYVFTKPKGSGWKSLIGFVHENFTEIGVDNFSFLLPILYEWNSKNKTGASTRKCGLITLNYFNEVTKVDSYFPSGNFKNRVIRTILNASSELIEELSEIFEEIILKKQKKHNTRYHDLVEDCLTNIESFPVSQSHPNQLLKLCALFWTHTPDPEDTYYGSSAGTGVEKHFGLEGEYSRYYPSSAFQTPTIALLRSTLKNTLDFILSFTNNAVNHYAKTRMGQNETESIELQFEDGTNQRQLISSRLWHMYRGTQVNTHILESMHMALESYLLDYGKKAKASSLETCLLYLLRNSQSASITSVVTSIVLSCPDKTFNVAKILFGSRLLFFYDTTRAMQDLQQKHTLTLFKKNMPSSGKNEIFENERITTCDLPHRKDSLENLLLKYQLFKSESVGASIASERQAVCWEILDSHYDQVPEESAQLEEDKIWRLYLARMDSRKMKPTTKKVEKGIQIELNPEIDPKLKEFSDSALMRSNDSFKYMKLRMWARYSIDGDPRRDQYLDYENSPKTAIKEAREIVKLIPSMNEDFLLMNKAIPSEVCVVLCRDHMKDLSKDDKLFCKNTILEAASRIVAEGYDFQYSDGTGPAIQYLYLLFAEFPESRPEIKILVLYALFYERTIDMAGTEFSIYAEFAIQSMWKEYPEHANSLILGYLILKPIRNQLAALVRDEKHAQEIYNWSEAELLERFEKENQNLLKGMIKNNLSLTDVEDLTDSDLVVLTETFRLVPLGTQDSDHHKLVISITSALSSAIFTADREDKIDYAVKHKFLEKFALFTLHLESDQIGKYLDIILENLSNTEVTADLFVEYISIQDRYPHYESFWFIWHYFENKVIELCNDGDSKWHTNKILQAFLFAKNPWKEDANKWSTFRPENSEFFALFSKKLPHCSSVLYSIAKLSNGIGSIYLEESIGWMSQILMNSSTQFDSDMEERTIFLLESCIKKYTYMNREDIKKNQRLKKKVLTILDFLMSKGSVVGYMLREDIL